MKIPMRRSHILIACASLIAFALPPMAGCGGGNIAPSDIPAACSEDRFRPNYCGDLAGLSYFPDPVITYRIVGPATATDIYTHPITAQEATEAQKTRIRNAFVLWAAQLGGIRQFQEVAATDTTAMIDIAVQNPGYFAATKAETPKNTHGILPGDVTGIVCVDENKQSRAFLEPLGSTFAWWSDKGKWQYGRAVVRLRSDLADDKFGDIAAHEVGHSLGIDGHSRSILDLMFAVSLPVIGAHSPTTRDGNTIRADYAER